jgi:hypothetical protein
MEFGSLALKSAVRGLIVTYFRAHRGSTGEGWPKQRLATWHEGPPQQGFPLRLEFWRLPQAFKAYKIAGANSQPPAWCRCRYREMHELEFWFASERDRTRTAMLVQLQGLGTVVPNRASLPASTPLKKVGPMTPAPASGLAAQQGQGDAKNLAAARLSGKETSVEFRALALAAFAVVGCGIAVYSTWASVSLRQRIDGVNASRQALAAELDRERQAVGTFADLRFKIEQARAEADQITQESERARSQLADTLKDLDVVQTTLARTSEDAHEQEERLADLERQYADTAHRLEPAKAALAETLILHSEAQTKLQALEQRRAEMEQEVAIPAHARSNVW